MHVTLVGVLGDRVRGDGYDNDIIFNISKIAIWAIPKKNQLENGDIN